MIRLLKRAWGGTRRWLQGLSAGWAVALYAVLGVVLLGGIILTYRAYEFIQHDNDFCNSCHLMAQPFAKFNQSAHRALGCKSCHRPSLVQRSRMALVAVTKNPSKVGEHAPVSNERCGECHVAGDPQKWKLISTSAGHRVHLESSNPALAGMQCITCHATSIHQFSTAAKTCAQSGCHENAKIQLGRMSNLEVHCSVCHEFNRPVSAQAPADSLSGKLQPRRADCLGCHAMRQRVRDLPADEPHKGVCGTCHNAHVQKTPQEAVKSCAAGTCHQRVDTVSAFHRGLGQGVLENCTTCHNAHDWKVKSTDCRACHSPSSLDRPRGRIAPSPHKVEMMSGGAFELVLLPYRLLFAALQQVPLRATAPGQPRSFSHKLHEALNCTSCHSTDAAHGTVRIKTASDCQSCHHSERNEARCTSCHTAQELAGTRERSLTVKFSVWSSARNRTFGFAHESHTEIDCRACHQEAPKYATVLSCESCHASHHDVARTCTSCHERVADPRIHDRRVHATCSGSGCHEAAALPQPVNARAVCLSCHTRQVNHEPGGDCASCHLIRPRSAALPERTR